MVFSYLKIANKIDQKAINIYEDDSGIEIEEMEDRVLTLREVALKTAIHLKDIHSLFKRGISSN